MRALEDELPGEHFNMWVRPLQAVESSGALKLLAPNRFAVDWVNAHLLSRLGEIVRRFVEGDAPIVTVEVGSRAPEQVQLKPVEINGVTRPKRSEGIVVGVRLNPDFTFNGFVEGTSNQLAKAAAVQVAENPGRSSFMEASGLARRISCKQWVTRSRRVIPTRASRTSTPSDS